MLLRIKVKPNSKTDEVIREDDGSFKVKIRAQPVEGNANKYLLAYLSKVLKLPKSSLTLLKGESNSFKTLEVDATEDYVNAVLKKASGSLG
jgi:uncharacterized protein (TIGR00251 family)